VGISLPPQLRKLVGPAYGRPGSAVTIVMMIVVSTGREECCLLIFRDLYCAVQVPTCGQRSAARLGQCSYVLYLC
jgi:hypothetical protein